ncbi:MULTISPECIES: hypothetical protein [unclassified Nonomuraea]|uniref:hypothetical protein n=1 Tax=unclassified Nonomuraea TaxID=2593643 RepID=UPI00340B827C
MTQRRTGGGPAPEDEGDGSDESDALLDALACGEPPPHDDPAARLLAALMADVAVEASAHDGQAGIGQAGAGEAGGQEESAGHGAALEEAGPSSAGRPVGQRRSSVSMTPST